MNRFFYFLIILNILSCAYPDPPPYLVGENHFTPQKVKKVAPYLHTDVIQTENSYELNNLPQGLKYEKGGWDEIVHNYKADLYYGIYKTGDSIYIYRRIDRWHHQEQEITKPKQFYELLKKEGYSNYKIIDTTSIVFRGPYFRMHIILLEYDGVKHQIRLMKNSVNIKSYPKTQQAYWESQGILMLDSPKEAWEKWEKENH